MRAMVIAVVVLACAGQTSAQSIGPVRIAWGAACAADAATTVVGLTHGLREVVLPTQNPTLAASLVAAECVAIDRGLTTLAVGHPKVARWLGISATVLRGWVVTSNLRALARR